MSASIEYFGPSPVIHDHQLCFLELLWRAPELLRKLMPPCGTPEGDVYSFGIILQEIVIRGEPYDSAQGIMEIEG